ncbi:MULTISPECIES: hypothetical protein [Sphingomonadales]|jgi:hypothetical protein|uniref:hypothetical protein n=1 Tax=Sphingomonadales TaxID=204457 RepID=UPI000B3C887E|nr:MULTISPECIES: hypothetical protein [Sphingomonadales]MBA4757602.1 hypothetical protein [Sphingosinicella sp.]
MTQDTQAYHRDDIAVWPDGVWATLGEVWAGHFTHRSDDYEIVRSDDHARLKALGVEEDLDIEPG